MKSGHNYYVYIVECADRSYYTGVTNDLEGRLFQHNSGENSKSYTFSRRPVTLKYYEHYNNINNAIAREKQFKGWSRKKKEALFKENWEVLKILAKNRQGT
jgi:putative endonuclease